MAAVSIATTDRGRVTFQDQQLAELTGIDWNRAVVPSACWLDNIMAIAATSILWPQ